MTQIKIIAGNLEIPFNALVNMEQSYSFDVPQYPTEKGFTISDTIIVQPLEMSMTLFVTDTPVTYDYYGVSNVVAMLKNLFFKKTPVTLITPDGVFYDMAITSCSFSKSADFGNAKEIPISFKQIIVTETRTASIPDSYGRSGATNANAGNANVTNKAKIPSPNDTPKINSQADYDAWQKSKNESKSSAAYKLAEMAGCL